MKIYKKQQHTTTHSGQWYCQQINKFLNKVSPYITDIKGVDESEGKNELKVICRQKQNTGQIMIGIYSTQFIQYICIG